MSRYLLTVQVEGTCLRGRHVVIKSHKIYKPYTIALGMCIYKESPEI